MDASRLLVRRSAPAALAAVLLAACTSGTALGPTAQVSPSPSEQASVPPRYLDGVAMDSCMNAGIPARCALVSVPEDRARSADRRLRLLVVVYPATDPAPRPDPVFFLAGGPGGSASATFSYALEAFPELHRARDFVLVDQRGTGQYGAIQLPPIPDTTGLNRDQLVDGVQSYVSAGLQTVDADPRLYTSWIAADDLDQVRDALGYDQVNLFGGSYGATMAQVYLAAHPEHVRTVTLTGVSLLDVPMFEHAAVGAQEALDKVFARCDADTACHAAYPNLRSDFASALAAVTASPVTTGVMNPRTGTPLVLDPVSFADAIEDFTVTVDLAAKLPRAIHHAAQGDFDDVAATLKLFMGPAESDNARLLMSLTIRCSEAWARWDPAATARNSAGAYAAESITTKAALMEAACSQVPTAAVPAADGRAVRSDKPVLLLVGGADPADPPENSIDAPVELPNSVTAVFPAGGHCVETYGCAPAMMTDFIVAGTAKGLDVSCAARAPIPSFEIGE